MAEIETGTLLPNDRVRRMVLAGEVTSVDERTLGDMTDADARREASNEVRGPG